MAALTWLDTQLFGIRTLQSSGTEVAKSPTLNFVGAGVMTVYNTATQAVDVTIAGGSSVTTNVTTATSTATTLTTYTPRLNTSTVYGCVVTARDAYNEVAKNWAMRILAVRGNGVSSLIASSATELQYPLVIGGDDPGWVCTLAASGNSLVVQGTGTLGESVYWHVVATPLASAPSPDAPARPAPTVTSVSPSSGDPATVNLLTITGTSFTGATIVGIGSTNTTSFSIVSPMQIQVSTAAGSVPGAADVSVTTPSGTGILRAAYTFAPSFDPATLPLSLFLKDYSTPGTWLGTVSAGTSADANNKVTTAAGGQYSPTLGAPINGHVPAVFDAMQQQSLIGSGYYIIGRKNADFGSIAALVKVTAVGNGSADAWSSPLIIGDGASGTYGIAVGKSTNDTVQAYWDAFNTPKITIESPVALGTYALYQQRWNTSIIEYRLNGGPWISAPFRAQYIDSNFALGKSAGSHYLSMEMLAAFASQTRLSDSDFNGLLTYSRNLSGLSLI